MDRSEWSLKAIEPFTDASGIADNYLAWRRGLLITQTTICLNPGLSLQPLRPDGYRPDRIPVWFIPVFEYICY
jgi:hypothetical protein